MNTDQPTITLRQRLQSHEKDIILEAMELHPSRIEQQRYLGVPSTTLWRKLTAHGLINDTDARA